VANTAVVDRQIHGTLTISVYGIPAAPAAPTSGKAAQNHAVTLTWKTPANHGATIEKYEVKREGDDKIWECGTNTCTIKPLQNDVAVQFRVRAFNKAGPSEWGELSQVFKPDQVPSAVTGLRSSNPRDRRITLSWNAVSGDFSPVTKYEIRWPGGKATAGAGETSKTVATAVNEKTPFSIWAWNRTGKSKKAGKTTGWPTGHVGSFSIKEPVTANDNADRSAVKLSWSAADPNGEGPTRYTVLVDGNVQGSCSNQTSTSCTTEGFELDGSKRTITVKATNKPAYYPATTATQTWYSEGAPKPPSSSTVKATSNDRELGVTLSVPPLRSFKDGWVELRASGGETKQKSVSKNGDSTWSTTIIGGANGTESDVDAKVCYTSMAGGEACTSWHGVGGDKPFGPLSGISINAGKDGILVSGSASADANGRQATLKITSSDGHSDSRTGTGNLSVDVGTYAANPDSDVTFTVTLDSVATDPARVTHKDDSRTVHTDAPWVSWSKGSAATGCPSGWASCSHVKLTLRNFRANSSVSCHVNGVGGAANWNKDIGVNGRGDWGEDNAPGLIVGDVTVDSSFGTCTQ
jgi:hypothetical protein